jgi:hypothetical protein
MNTFGKIIAGIVVLVSIYGCGSDQPKSSAPDEYKTIDGQIVSVQRFSIPFYYTSNYHITANYDFQFVIVDSGGEHHTLVYPEAYAIVQQSATVKYRVIPSGKMSTDEFLHRYVSTTLNSLVINNLTTEGVICTDGGIKYLK